LLSTQVFVSQELLKPVLKFTNACASDSFNSYELEVTFINAVFNSDNVFTLELSNKDGDFSSPTALNTISDKNSAFRFTSEFSIPDNVAGANYKIRVKSSSPEIISPESDAFEAYYMSLDALVLNNFENISLCEAEPKEISVNYSGSNQLQWYKDGQEFVLGGSSITVNDPGLYYCEIYYGSCNSPATSNIIEVSISSAVDAEILGNSEVYLCENESYILEANVDNNLYTYSWFKNNEKLTNLPAYSPTLTISDLADFGTYRLEITNEIGCTSTSNEVNINSVNTDFSVSIDSATPINILAGETRVIAITHNAQNAEITWYRNNVEIPNSNSLSLNITESGTYFAAVKNTANSCTETKNSGNIVVNYFQDFETIITINSDYTSCVSSEAQLFIETIKGIDANNVAYNLTDTQIALLNFAWFKDNNPINGATENQINISTFTNNGVYFVQTSNGNVSSNSNTLDVNLKLPTIEISSSSASNTYCDNKQIVLSSDVNIGLNYQWYLDDTAIANATNDTYEITQTGVYYLVQSDANGCTTKSNEIEFTNVNNNFSVNTISETENFILFGETKVLEITHTAQNATLNWFKDGVLIQNSTTTTLTITEPGTYYAAVTNTVDGCSETKQSENINVNAVESFDVLIKPLPNYSDCVSERTQLLLESVKAKDENQNIYDLTHSQISLLNFNWYKNSNILNGFTDNQITIENHVENGSYFLEVSNGSIKSESNVLDVVLGVFEPVISSNDQTNIYCSTKQITLSSTQQNGVTYQWLLNGSPITNANETTLEITEAGVYQIEVKNDEGCSKKSTEIVIENFDSNFTISSTTTAATIILEGETRVLNVTHNAQNAIITWFKDNVEIPNSNSNNLNVTEPGVYFAQVTITANGCSETKSINAISVSAVSSLITVINASPNYSECTSLQTQLTYKTIEARDVNGTTYQLSAAQIQLLEFQWYKDNNILNGYNEPEITINDYEENGAYYLKINSGSKTSTSNILAIKLGLPEVNVASVDDIYALCTDKEIILSTPEVNGLSYQWYLNNTAIAGETNTTLTVVEVGNYIVEAVGYSCSKTSSVIAINSFDGSTIEFDFDDEITIQEGETKIISVNGADTYEWFDEDNNLIETSSSLEITKAGNYRVIAYLNGCSIEKFFTVTVISGNIYVPNVLTPNGDGVNDSWKIPSEFAFKPNIEVEIISNAGRTVLRQKNYQNNWPDINVKTASLYFYIIRSDENIIKRGTINIIR